MVRPPAAFASHPLILHTVPVGATWRRLYASHHPSSLGIGRGRSRFSDPDGTAFGVMYLGSSLKVAFVEVILRDLADGRAGTMPILYAELERYKCAEIRVTEELRLVDLTGDAGLVMGVPSDAIGAKDQEVARLWSAAFHSHPDAVDGVYYPSRLNEERNIALYERAKGKLKPVATPLLVECRDELADVITSLNLAII